MTPDKSDVLYSTLGLTIIKTLGASIVERFLEISEDVS
jgi:hypothetical protein